MKYEAEIRETFINNAIHLIATGGFEKATTKNLTFCKDAPEGVKMNEVYIYRLFGSKEALYEAAFLSLEQELYCAMLSSVGVLGDCQGDARDRLYELFLKAWGFVLKNEERCRCYVRYYYSVYFTGESLKKHQRDFVSVIVSFQPLFKEEADVSAIMHSVFTMLFDFAIRVYNGDLENSEENRHHIFNVLYCMMMTYFKDTAKA